MRVIRNALHLLLVTVALCCAIIAASYLSLGGWTLAAIWFEGSMICGLAAGGVQ